MKPYRADNSVSHRTWKEFFYKVYLYALRKVSQENIWHQSDAQAIAYDVAMDSIAAYLMQTHKGHPVLNKFAFVMKSVFNELQGRRFIFQCMMRRRSESIGIVTCANDEAEEATGLKSYPLLQATMDHVLQDGSDTFHMLQIIDILKEYGLTPVEISVAALHYQGYSGKQIAQQLGMTPSRSSRILQQIRVKLQGLREKHQ